MRPVRTRERPQLYATSGVSPYGRARSHDGGTPLGEEG